MKQYSINPCGCRLWQWHAGDRSVSNLRQWHSGQFSIACILMCHSCISRGPCISLCQGSPSQICTYT